MRCLLYNAGTTWPVIYLAASYFTATYMRPVMNSKSAKHVIRYLTGSEDLGSIFRKNHITKLTSFCDSDGTEKRSDRNCITACVFLSVLGDILWRRKICPLWHEVHSNRSTWHFHLLIARPSSSRNCLNPFIRIRR